MKADTQQSQADKIKADLINGGVVNSVQAFKNHHITRLAAIIKRLRDKGLPVITTTEPESKLAFYRLPDGWQPDPHPQTDTHKKAR